MEHLTEEQILEKYEKLPNDLKEAIFGAEVTEAVNGIGGKYNLHIDKIGELANETGMVMLGMVSPKDFIRNLSERLEVNMETAGKIASDVNSQVFLKVRESLKKLHNGEEIETQNEVKKEDILKEIEHEPELPGVLVGAKKPEEVQNLFEIKTKEEIQRAPMQETKYQGVDPYRESTS